MNPYPLLFQPGRIGTLALRNRIVMAPLGTNLAGTDGGVTRELIDWCAARAWGGAGLVIVENSLADVRFGRGLARALRLDDPRFTPGLNALAEAVQAAGAKIAIQINIQGAGVDMDLLPGVQPVGPSDLAYVFDSGPGSGLPARMRKPKQVRALRVEEMKELCAAFTRASAVVKAAGFDALEIHGAHGYLLAGFLSPFSNRRQDEYGGELEGRVRFAAEVYAGIRAEVGPEFPILFRFSGREYLEGGREIEEARALARRLEEMGVDALHISAGISMRAESYTWMNPPASFSPGAFIEDARAIREAVRIPVIGVGKIRDPRFAESLLAEGKADFIGLGRTLIADPEWPRKAREGREREIRRCISCNRCLRIMYRRTIRCAVNARAGQEGAFPIVAASRPRRVAVVGGGPAGMEAARAAAERGHRVTLFEKERSLGGQLRLALIPPGKKDLAGFLAGLRSQAMSRAEVRLGKKIEAEDLLRERFDFVIVATGCAPPQRPGFPGAARAWDVLAGKVKLQGGRAVVAGESRVACETAEFLARRQKKEVKIIHPGTAEALGREMEAIFERRLILQRLREWGVEILHETTLVGLTPEGIRVQGPGAESIAGAHLVMDEPPLPERSLLKELEGKVEVTAAGDCLEPRDIYNAIHQGFLAGYRIK